MEPHSTILSEQVVDGEPQDVTHVPQQGQVGIAIGAVVYPIHSELHLTHFLSCLDSIPRATFTQRRLETKSSVHLDFAQGRANVYTPRCQYFDASVEPRSLRQSEPFLVAQGRHRKMASELLLLMGS